MEKIKFVFEKNGKPVNISLNTLNLRFALYLKNNCFGDQCTLISKSGVNSVEYRNLIKRFIATHLKMVQQLKDFNVICELLYSVLVKFVDTKK